MVKQLRYHGFYEVENLLYDIDSPYINEFAEEAWERQTMWASRRNMIRMDNPVTPVEIMVEKTLYGYGGERDQ